MITMGLRNQISILTQRYKALKTVVNSVTNLKRGEKIYRRKKTGKKLLKVTKLLWVKTQQNKTDTIVEDMLDNSPSGNILNQRNLLSII